MFSVKYHSQLLFKSHIWPLDVSVDDEIMDLKLMRMIAIFYVSS